MSVGLLAAGSLISGLLGASSARRAARAQEALGREEIALRREIHEDGLDLLRPRVQAGDRANSALQYELGLGSRPQAQEYTIQEMTRPGTSVQPTIPTAYSNLTRGGEQNALAPMAFQSAPSGPESYYMIGDREFDTRDAAQEWIDSQQGNFDYGGYQQTPGYSAQFDEGMNAIGQYNAARGMRFSGDAAREAMTFGQNLANQDYGNYLNRLFSMSDRGQTATGQQINSGQVFASGAGNALQGIGQAQAQGISGANDAFQNMGNNLFRIYGMHQAGVFS